MPITRENAREIGRLGGRPPGSRNKLSLFMQDFSRDMFRSQKFQDNIRAQFEAGTLDPRLYVVFFHYGFGRPPIKLVLEAAGARGRSDLVARVRALSREDRLAFAEYNRRLLEIEGRMLAAPEPVVVDAVAVRVGAAGGRTKKVKSAKNAVK